MALSGKHDHPLAIPGHACSRPQLRPFMSPGHSGLNCLGGITMIPNFLSCIASSSGHLHRQPSSSTTAPANRQRLRSTVLVHVRSQSWPPHDRPVTVPGRPCSLPSLHTAKPSVVKPSHNRTRKVAKEKKQEEKLLFLLKVDTCESG